MEGLEAKLHQAIGGSEDLKEQTKKKGDTDPTRDEQNNMDHDTRWSKLPETEKERLLELCFSKLYGIPKPAARPSWEKPSKRWLKQEPGISKPGELGHLCEVCHHVDFQYLVGCPIAQVLESFKLFPLKWALYREEDCAFCRLVAKTVRGASVGRQIVTEVEGKDVMCDFRMLPKAMNPGGRAEMILLLAPPPEGFDPLILSEYNARKDVMARMTNLGVSFKSPQADYELIKEWCHGCVSGHGGPDSFTGQDRDLPPGFRLIDVSQQCIVPYKQGAQYMTLSYVWGGVATLRNTKALCKDLAMSGALINEERKLPNTIKDAIALTEKLGGRYLWVDSLCIIQDDEADKAIQIAAMDQIYSSSILTIAAASGANANSGLPGISAGPRTFQRHVGSIQGLHLANLPTRWSYAIDKSVWNSRAWTLQERVSSPRVLYFGTERCFFTCHHNQLSFLESDDTIENGLERPTWSSSLGDGNVNLIPTTHTANISAYRRVVQVYTSRHLTFSSDILLAFKALEARFQPLFRSDFLFGLPRSELDSQLIWQPGAPLKRRRDPDTNLPIFPTWSWAGWVGKANCNDDEQLSRIKWIEADGTRFSPQDFRFPDGANADVYKRLGYRNQWSGALEKGVPYYKEKSRPEHYFFHPTAPEEERRLGPNLKAGTNHLVFAAETTSLRALKVEFGHYWAMSLFDHRCTGCEDDENDKHTVCPLVIRDRDDFVAGYVLIPAEISLRMRKNEEGLIFEDAGRYELVRLSRTKPEEQTGQGEEGGWGGNDPDLLVDEEAVTIERTDFPDRPDVEKSTHKCACDQRRFDVRKPWCLYNVMLVEWVGRLAEEGGAIGRAHKPKKATKGKQEEEGEGEAEEEKKVAYRMGVGTVHIDAWAQARPMERIITLG